MTYDELRSTLHTYMHRGSDQALTDNEPWALEQARYKVGRLLRVPDGYAAVDLVPITDGVWTAPADLAEFDVLKDGFGAELEQVPTRMYGRREGEFCISGTQVLTATGLDTLTALYWRTVPLIQAGESNWASEFYPDVWVGLAVVEQWLFLQDGEARAMAQQGVSERIVEANVAGRDRTTKGGTVRMRARGQ